MLRKSFSFALFLFISFSLSAQVDTSLLGGIKWRMIGPHRGGRTVAAAGVPQQPNVFYIGVNNGGVWKTTDYGRTWNSIFDDQSTGSIGSIAIAPSDPNIIYVGSGEGLQRPDLSVGNGIYKSTDAGKTWTHLGLQNGQQIPKIAVDPKDPNKVFVAVLGHPYGSNEERGIFRSLDGGKSFEKVLYINENVGGDDVDIDPSNPNILYATMWKSRQGPWENGVFVGNNGGIFKSTDDGTTWKKINKGLPENLVQAHVAIAASSPNTIYTVFSTTVPNEYGTGKGMGLYRSDDGGETWKNTTADGRPEAKIGGGDLPEIAVDPTNADVLYTASIVVWKSTDGGRNWNNIRGAPGGDDYQNIWINPLHPEIFLLTSDQGAIVTVNGGKTYSSWYNQPTAQFYHVATDNAFPYNVYGAQQESGSVGIASRGNDGQITFREWHPVGVEEWGYVAPDPRDPNIIYGGKISRHDKRTGQTQNIAPKAPKGANYRFLRTAPVIFSTVDPKTLFYAGNVLFKTRDGGNNWQVISSDLTRESWDIPPSVGVYNTPELKKMKRRGVIYTIAPSYKDMNTIWCGTDDGLIHVTTDGGKTWKNVTPPAVTSWSKVSLMDAGHFDVNTAYAAVNRIKLDDMHPHIYRTHDGGRTWKEIVDGLPNDPVNAVREDPVQKGLLFASTERAVYFSIDDGDHWQSLRLNMPASSMRDVVVKDNDLVVATHGRSFWILDDIARLRELTKISNNTTLFKPTKAYRVRWNMNTDTPLPPEEPGGENPPDGAIIDYYLPVTATGVVTLEIVDAKGNTVRRYGSNDTLYKVDTYIPPYWIRPQQILPATAGAHRFVWDLHYQPSNQPAGYPIAAVYQNTAPDPTSPWVMPGTFAVKLTANGKTYSQPLQVVMDPRVKTSSTDLQLQHDLSLQLYGVRKKLMVASWQVDSTRATLKQKLTTAQWKTLDDSLAVLQTALSAVSGEVGGAYGLLQESEMPLTTQAVAGAKEAVVNAEWALGRLRNVTR